MHEQRGKILKVKMGYNANSSSVAAIVTVFIWSSAAVATLLNAFYAFVFSKRKEA